MKHSTGRGYRGGCGSTTPEGYCEDGNAVCCDGVWRSCIGCLHEQVCALGADGYRCIDIEVPTDGQVRVTGTWMFEKRDLGPNGYGAPRPMPVRYATLKVLDGNNQYVATGATDENGAFSIDVPAGTGPLRLAVLATASTDRHALSVRDCRNKPMVPIAIFTGLFRIHSYPKATRT